MNESIDPECALAAAYAPPSRRARLLLLWRLDAMLGRIVATTREPALGAVRLLWWRDALAALDRGPPPAEPLLRAVAAELLPAGVRGEALAEIEGGWATVLAGGEGEEVLRVHAAERGVRLFAVGARLLGGEADDRLRLAGEGWALVDLARRGAVDPATALAEARRRFERGGNRAWPSKLRPLGMLAMLARRDARSGALAAQGSPARLARMMAHRLTGH